MPPIIAAAVACGADSGAHAIVTSPYPDTAALARDLPGLLRMSAPAYFWGMLLFQVSRWIFQPPSTFLSSVMNEP